MPPVGGNGELFIDTWLTNLSVDFLSGNDMFISDKVFPLVPVQRESGKYIIWDRGSFLRDEMRERPLGGRADVADWSKSEDTYRVVERALAHKLDDRQRANADSQVNLDRAAMRKLVTAAAINNDRRWATAYFGTGIWTTDWAGGVDFTQFDNTSAGVPTLEIQKAKNIIQKFGVDGDNFILVAGIDAHTTLIENADLIDRIKYTRMGIMTNDLIASMLGVKKYLVANSIYNTAQEPLAESIDYILPNPDDMLLVYAPDAPGLEVPSAGYTFAWSGLLGGAGNTFGGVMQRGRDDFAHSDHFEIRTANDIKLVSADLGLYLADVTA